MNPRRNPLHPPTALVGVLLVLLAACGAAGGGPESASGERVVADVRTAPTSQFAEPDPEPEPGIESVVLEPLANARTIDGAPLESSAMAGRPTVAWFWAPWCAICRAEAGDVMDVAREYGGRVNFIGIAGRGANDEMHDFVSDTDTGDLVHVDDSSGEIWTWFSIYAQPAFAFITDDGRMETFVGGLGRTDLASVVDQLLAA